MSALLHSTGLGASEFEDKLREPVFRSAWQEIETRLRGEGASGPTMDLARTAFLEAYKGVGMQPGVTGEQAIAAAKEYVLVGKTIAGAVSTVQGLINAANSGAPPAELVGAFSGVMVGAVVAAGAVSAGVGAAIVAGIGLAINALKELGLFGQPPRGVEVCPRVFCDPAPTFVIRCTCVWGSVVTSPSSVYWRPFPEPTTDPVWYKHAESDWGNFHFDWRDARWSGAGIPRPIDALFPEFFHLDCERAAYAPGQIGEFQRAYFAAWKINKAYALNGLNPVDDWKVLVQTIRMWNNAHEPGETYVIPHRPRSSVSQASKFGCRPAVPYIEIVAKELAEKAPNDAPNGVVRIHTGPLKRVKKIVLRGRLAELSQRQSSTGLVGKALIGVAATGAISAAALAAYAAYKKISFATALNRVVSKVTARENPIGSDRKTSKGRKLAYRVRLDGKPPIEYVQMWPDGTAVLFRHGHRVARFRPTKYQFAKISAGDGELLIFTDQLI